MDKHKLIEQKTESMRKSMHILSHDLRNPLLNIQALVQEASMLVEDAKASHRDGKKAEMDNILEHEMPEVLSLLKQSAARMDDLVVGANEIYHCLFNVLECEPVDMQTMVTRCSSKLNLARERFEISCSMVAQVNADPLAVQQIVCALFKNAQKAVNTKGECARVIHVSSSDAEGYLTFFIKDEGCGLSEDERKHAFDPFYSGQSFAGGAGLGLTLAKALVEQHGGFIQIESIEGVSTTVMFSLPQV
ncbi:MAG: HAMP domain-containing sensor histidine kinase [Ghiorsea sp.]